MKNIIDLKLKELDKSRYWLSKETNITYPNIIKICNNQTESIKFSSLESICKALNCTLNDLFIIE